MNRGTGPLRLSSGTVREGHWRRLVWALLAVGLCLGVAYRLLSLVQAGAPAVHPTPRPAMAGMPAALDGASASPAPLSRGGLQHSALEFPAAGRDVAAALAAGSSSLLRQDPKTDDSPYRLLAHAGTGTDRAFVLFGRGRVLTLHGPGPIDDEYEVEAVFADYLVLRHRPTATGSLLRPLRRAVDHDALRNPEELPRD